MIIDLSACPGREMPLLGMQNGSSSRRNYWFGEPYRPKASQDLSKQTAVQLWSLGRTCRSLKVYFTRFDACEAIQEFLTEKGLSADFYFPVSKLIHGEVLRLQISTRQVREEESIILRNHEGVYALCVQSHTFMTTLLWRSIHLS